MIQPLPISKAVRRLRRAGLVLGPLLAAAAYLFLPRSFVDASGALVELGTTAPATAALLVWMAVWWMTEAVDVEATGLLPLAAGPLIGAGSLGVLAAPYASPLVFLFLGGFLMSLALQRWELDKRIALLVLAWVGTRPRRVIGGFMLVTAGLSAVVSNTATAAAMLPLALSVTRRLSAAQRTPQNARSFETALMLGIAYAASIGGLATLIGSPPNGFLAQYATEHLDRPMRFLDWARIGIPLTIVFLPIAWWLLTRVLHRVDDEPLAGGRELVVAERRALGPMQSPQWATLVVFALAVLLWILAPFLGVAGLSDAGVAIGAGLLLLVLPVGGRRLLTWSDTRDLPFGVLILFGGGLALAGAVEASGLDALIGAQCRALSDWPPLLLVVALTTIMVGLTEVMSNSASAAILVPIVATMARELDLDPLTLVVPVTLAASLGFMLPAATPPNAIVFASGSVTAPHMARCGFVLNLVGIVLVVVMSRLLVG